MLRARFRRNKAILRTAYLALPIVALCSDFLLYPRFFEGYENHVDIDIARLVTQKDQLLGTFRAHNIRVAMDEDIQDREYLAHLKTDNNALLVSAYVDEDGEIEPGGLVNAVVNALRVSYAQDAQLIIDTLRAQNKIHLGRIVSLELHTAMQKPRNLPIKYLIIVPLPYGDPEESKKRLPDSLDQALELTDKERILNLIVPCLGTNWGNKNSIGLDDFFSALFRSIPISTSPRNIYLSFYNEWPTFYLEAAVSSLNSSWRRSFAGTYRDFPALYQREFRLITTFLILCLLVASFSARMTLKNGFIVGAAFVGSCTALERGIIDQLRQALNPAWALTLEIAMLAASAILFRFIVTSAAKDVFE